MDSRTQRRSWPARALGMLGDVRPGEGATAARMGAALFFVMSSYYMVKPLREGWIAASAVGGLSRVEIKAYSSLAQSLLLIVAVAVYVRLAARCSRRALVSRTSLACVATLLAFWLLQPGFVLPALPGVGIAFYLWVGMFGVFIVAQFWAFATDLYGDERGRRLLPLVALGGTAGAAAGSWLHGWLTAHGPETAHAVLLAAAVPLAAATALSRMVAGAGDGRPVGGRARRRYAPRLLGDRFVLAAGLLALVLSWVSTNGENLLFQAVQDGIARTTPAAGIDAAAALEHARVATTTFYGDFYFWTNVAALAAQLLLTSRLLRHGGLAALIFALPLLALVASAAAALAPALAVFKWIKVTEQATDYSLNHTARQVLWLPASAETKYESKPTVDAIFVRVGDGLAALTVLAASHAGASSTTVLVAVNLTLVGLWLAAAAIVLHEHRRLTAADAGQPTPRRYDVRGAVRRARRRARAIILRLPSPAEALVTLLGLLPSGRGHPPPAWQPAG